MNEESMERITRRLNQAMEQILRERDGVAQQAQWQCEDGWIVVYTTGRVRGGPHDGRFVTQTFRPTGPGARTGDPSRWVRNYERAFATRKAAKARAIQLYRQHSPRWSARHPEETR